MVYGTFKVFMDDFIVVVDYLTGCLTNLRNILQHYVKFNPVSNGENATLWLKRALC